MSADGAEHIGQSGGNAGNDDVSGIGGHGVDSLTVFSLFCLDALHDGFMQGEQPV